VANGTDIASPDGPDDDHIQNVISEVYELAAGQRRIVLIKKPDVSRPLTR